MANQATPTTHATPTATERTHASGYKKLKQVWPELSLFKRFEYIVMLIVSCLLAVIILVALFRLVGNVYQLVVSQAIDTTEFKAFQVTFGMMLTLLIAFEFRNSINAMLEGKWLFGSGKNCGTYRNHCVSPEIFSA